jgi:hypothetical protein
MPRLTNDMRTEFVRAVLADLPHDPTKDDLTAAIREIVMAKTPPEVKVLWEDDVLKTYLDKQYVSVFDSETGAYEWNVTSFQAGPFPNGAGMTSLKVYEIIKENAKVRTLFVKWRDAVAKRKDLKVALESTAKGCSTVEKLRKALPELEKHMPDGPATATANLPTANTVAVILSELGWKEPEPAV